MKSKNIMLRLPVDLIEHLDAVKITNRYPSRASLIRRLIVRQLEAVRIDARDTGKSADKEDILAGIENRFHDDIRTYLRKNSPYHWTDAELSEIEDDTVAHAMARLEHRSEDELRDESLVRRELAAAMEYIKRVISLGE